MSRRDEEKIELAVTLEKQTERAVLINDGDRKVWLAKSQVEPAEGEFPEDGEHFELLVPEWLAKKEGLL